MVEWDKIIEMMQIIKTGDNIVFDNEDGAFKITKIEDAPVVYKEDSE